MHIKNILPKSLFGRALLILIAPILLIQLSLAYLFFDRHIDNVTRHMSIALAGEVAFFTQQIDKASLAETKRLTADFEKTTGIHARFLPVVAFDAAQATDDFPEFQEQLRGHIDVPFTVRRAEGGSIETLIRLPKQTLALEVTVKRLESRTTVLFAMWMAGLSAGFLLIAIIFMRNQIRPIRKLAEAADSFGRGIDMPNFRPNGASEVRKAARAFLIMRERIKRQMRTRTEMLAGISHDLRTPLTRMKLQLAMLNGDAIAELQDDVQQMEHMIAEYLDFARGEGGEEPIRLNLRHVLEEVVSDYQRAKADIRLLEISDVLIDLRPSGFRRMLHNVIDNALRYGKRCEVSLRAGAASVEIAIDDEGPGIPAAQREEVFKPFARLDPSRNSKTGGVGLGLSIARDIALVHGGSISLATSPAKGLRVIIRLPL